MSSEKETSNLCEVCKEREHNHLCDFAVDSVITSNFDVLTSSCDKKLCGECAVNLWPDCDVCPEHAAEVNEKLSKAV
ncbi:hypothetical protein [Niallia taxi]|uniref:hypothetical protein n=1 Tax=Niallia taxi TaxID=2499688 RepID=UPI00254D908A|nr:hypothetical protein [Niallia taxi]MDK8641306.1 hypothetical protein [Niallia taxi]